MSKYVLDASAMLAVIYDEPGADAVGAVFTDSVIGAVNLAEVYSKMTERGDVGRDGLNKILTLIGGIVPFSAKHAALTGGLRPSTARLGLSLGDRACLALGIDLGAEIFTAERLWKKLSLPCSIHIIR